MTATSLIDVIFFTEKEMYAIRTLSNIPRVGDWVTFKNKNNGTTTYSIEKVCWDFSKEPESVRVFMR
jgi:hypothetical protein